MMPVGIVDLTADRPSTTRSYEGEVAWSSNWTELNTRLRAEPVDTVVFQVDLDQHPGLMLALVRVKEANPNTRLILSAISSVGTVSAEVTAVAGPRASAREVLLTGRELQVLGAIRSGRTNREIAANFGISVSTVNRHVESILHKLSARNRAQAAAAGSHSVAARDTGDGDTEIYPHHSGAKLRDGAASV